MGLFLGFGMWDELEPSGVRRRVAARVLRLDGPTKRITQGDFVVEEELPPSQGAIGGNVDALGEAD